MRAKRFTPEIQAAISDFDCGPEQYAKSMTDWITGEAVQASIQRGTAVWLFYTDDHNDLIGFGSLGTTDWQVPTQSDPFVPVSIIPALAVSVRFQRQGPSEESPTYARMILDFLILKAVAAGRDRLVLYVDKRNEHAIRLYRKVGFAMLPDSYKRNRKMLLDLSDKIKNAPAGS